MPLSASGSKLPVLLAILILLLAGFCSMMVLSGDRDTSILIKKIYAHLGDSDAQLFIGRVYYAGSGVPRDTDRGLEWIRRSAENKNLHAYEWMANIHFKADGTPADKAEYFKWIRMAAENGSGRAQNDLGYAYLTGFGTDKDYIEAEKWLLLAQEKHVLKATANLYQVYSNPDSPRYNQEKSLEIIKVMAENKDPAAQLTLGIMHAEGKLDQSSDAEAMRLLKEAAANSNDPVANYNLARAYTIGLNGEKNLNEAARLSLMAAAEKISPAIDLLVYIAGEYIAINEYSKAYVLLNVAKNHGNIRAEQILNQYRSHK